MFCNGLKATLYTPGEGIWAYRSSRCCFSYPTSPVLSLTTVQRGQNRSQEMKWQESDLNHRLVHRAYQCSSFWPLLDLRWHLLILYHPGTSGTMTAFNRFTVGYASGQTSSVRSHAINNQKERATLLPSAAPFLLTVFTHFCLFCACSEAVAMSSDRLYLGETCPALQLLLQRRAGQKRGGCLAGASLGAHQQKHTKGPFFNSGHRSAWVSRDTKLHVGVSQKPGTTLTTLFFVQVNLGPLRGEWWFLWGYRSTWFGSSRTDCQACGWPQGSTGRDGLSRFRGGTAVLYYWVMDGDGTEPLRGPDQTRSRSISFVDNGPVNAEPTFWTCLIYVSICNTYIIYTRTTCCYTQDVQARKTRAQEEHLMCQIVSR